MLCTAFALEHLTNTIARTTPLSNYCCAFLYADESKLSSPAICAPLAGDQGVNSKSFDADKEVIVFQSQEPLVSRTPAEGESIPALKVTSAPDDVRMSPLTILIGKRLNPTWVRVPVSGGSVYAITE